jgi:hypothetical protein
VVITSTKSPSSFTEAITLTATVTGGADGNRVIFKEGLNVLASSTLSGGIATFSSNSLAAGSHVITAEYYSDPSGTTKLGESSFNQVVNSLIFTLTSSKNPSAVNTSVTFTATVLGTGGWFPTTGTVTFKIGTSSFGSCDLSTSGKAIGSKTFTAIGTYSITAVYNVTNQSAALSQSVTKTGKSGSNIDPVDSEAITTFSVYPNPASGPATFKFNLKESSNATIIILSSTGQVVQKAWEGYVKGGEFKYVEMDNKLANGLYFIQLRTGSEIKTIRLVVTTTY